MLSAAAEALSVGHTQVKSDLCDASTDVAWRLSANKSYEGKQARAVAALRKRVPGSTTEECEDALIAALGLFEACKATLAEHAGSFLHVRGDYDFSPLHEFLVPELETFTEARVDSMLGMVLLYYHLK